MENYYQDFYTTKDVAALGPALRLQPEMLPIVLTVATISLQYALTLKLLPDRLSFLRLPLDTIANAARAYIPRRDAVYVPHPAVLPPTRTTATATTRLPPSPTVPSPYQNASEANVTLLHVSLFLLVVVSILGGASTIFLRTKRGTIFTPHSPASGGSSASNRRPSDRSRNGDDGEDSGSDDELGYVGRGNRYHDDPGPPEGDGDDDDDDNEDEDDPPANDGDPNDGNDHKSGYPEILPDAYLIPLVFGLYMVGIGALLEWLFPNEVACFRKWTEGLVLDLIMAVAGSGDTARSAWKRFGFGFGFDVEGTLQMSSQKGVEVSLHVKTLHGRKTEGMSLVTNADGCEVSLTAVAPTSASCLLVQPTETRRIDNIHRNSVHTSLPDPNTTHISSTILSVLAKAVTIGVTSVHDIGSLIRTFATSCTTSPRVATKAIIRMAWGARSAVKHVIKARFTDAATMVRSTARTIASVKQTIELAMEEEFPVKIMGYMRQYSGKSDMTWWTVIRAIIGFMTVGMVLQGMARPRANVRPGAAVAIVDAPEVVEMVVNEGREDGDRGRSLMVESSEGSTVGVEEESKRDSDILDCEGTGEKDPSIASLRSPSEGGDEEEGIEEPANDVLNCEGTGGKHPSIASSRPASDGGDEEGKQRNVVNCEGTGEEDPSIASLRPASDGGKDIPTDSHSDTSSSVTGPVLERAKEGPKEEMNGMLCVPLRTIDVPFDAETSLDFENHVLEGIEDYHDPVAGDLVSDISAEEIALGAMQLMQALQEERKIKEGRKARQEEVVERWWRGEVRRGKQRAR